MTVIRTQRFSRERPCPVCGGYDKAARGRGERCFGFLGTDGAYAHCTREQYAGQLPLEPESETYAHLLTGECRCGQSHNTGAPTAARATPSSRRIVEVFPYPGFEVVRFEPKSFAARHRVNGDYVWSLNVQQPYPLYRRDELLAASPAEFVFIPEGERKVDRLRGLGLVAVCNPFGALKWRLVDQEPLRNRRVVILPDNDAAKQGKDHRKGERHADEVVQRLQGTAAEIRVLMLPGLSPDGGDVVNWLNEGHGKEDLLNLADATPIGGVRGSETVAVVVVGSDVTAETPQELSGSVVLDEIAGFYRRYVVLSSEQSDVLALWTMHTHTFSAAEATPYLHLTSAEKSSGKTRTMEVAETLAHRPWLTGRVSPAALVRKVATEQPALMFDEVDAAFKSGEEFAEAVRGILNTGYRSSGRVSLCVVSGKNIEVRDFKTFCPKMFSGIGKSLPDTVANRSIVIALKRRARDEHIARFRERAAWSDAKPLRERLARWAQTNVETLKTAEPDLPEELDDRAQDVWEPLLAIADLAGGTWPERARKAARGLSADAGRKDDSLGVRLLSAVREAFGGELDRLKTKDLITRLVADEEGPWRAFGKKGDPISPRALAETLRPFGVESRNVREEGQAKGYYRASFTDAWTRYLPSETSQRPNASGHGKNSDLLPSQDLTWDASETAEKPNNDGLWDGGTDTKRPEAESVPQVLHSVEVANLPPDYRNWYVQTVDYAVTECGMSRSEAEQTALADIRTQMERDRDPMLRAALESGSITEAVYRAQLSEPT